MEAAEGAGPPPRSTGARDLSGLTSLHRRNLISPPGTKTRLLQVRLCWYFALRTHLWRELQLPECILQGWHSLPAALKQPGANIARQLAENNLEEPWRWRSLENLGMGKPSFAA